MSPSPAVCSDSRRSWLINQLNSLNAFPLFSGVRNSYIKELNKLLSEKIRNGEININDDSLKDHLIRTTMAKLSIDQPHYSGYLKGKEDNYPNDSES